MHKTTSGGISPSQFPPTRPRGPLIVGILSFATIFCWHPSAYAYIGPGAGFAFLGSFFIFFLTLILAGAALISWPFRLVLRFVRKKPDLHTALTERVVVVGLDGLDPVLLEEYMEEGLLPHFVSLRNQGTYCHLETTLPALSPVAWTSFQTGVNPGKHNIFDFLHRNPKTYFGELSSARIRPPSRFLRIGPFNIPLGKPEITLLRKSQPFWRILGDHGVFSLIQRVPITFPPERFRGISLSAMCVPDLRGTQGTFTYYTTYQQAPSTRTGGQTFLVTWERNSITTWIQGPDHPFRNLPTPLKVPLVIERNGPGLVLKIQGKTYHVSAKEYTPWIRICFRAGIRIRGIVRFYLHDVEPHLSLYMTPIHLDPEKPALPISHPMIYSVYLAKKFGSFATLGLSEDTWALNEGALDDSSFLEQCYSIHSEREAMFFDALQRVRKGLLMCVFDITDRVQHMFWRYMDPQHPAHQQHHAGRRVNDAIRDVYTKMDDMLGKLLTCVDDRTWLFVISDHGFKSFRRGVNLNTWLFQNGYLHLKEPTARGEWLQGVDWDRTRAFALGLGGLFVNQRGRERHGVVAPGQETERLKRTLMDDLKGLRDLHTGNVAIVDVYDSTKVYKGPYKENAPDLIIGYNEGYRASWESVTGQITDEVFSDNIKCWSGDHCIDPHKVPGVFLANRKLPVEHVGMVDIAPTILRLFGISPPDYMDGKALVNTAPDSNPNA